MEMKEVLAPIKEDLEIFESYIDKFIDQVQHDKIKSNYTTFFDTRGKYLRPSLLMIATGAISGDKSCFDEKLYKLGLILELIHSASLVHDDIVDNDLERRGSKTINQVFGNKIAVLAGDTLFSYAFKEATLNYDKSLVVPVTTLALNMCMAELEQANKIDSLESYLRVIKGKTAEFMAVACELGARYAHGNEEEISLMSEIGLNIGMTYQMIDDMIDEDENALKYINNSDLQDSYRKASDLIGKLTPSIYAQSMLDLLDYIMAMKA